ncbi:5-oxoprolinase subunit PxpB [Deinococcus humi]|uniref:KipI family sensor histidine kinase inhibitor n=1 Tax=Deinococcus humi TaxID=662880 RepID=A0A7W8NFP0_9DEIO|nr:5-oxoprolinase subunit PxpB [Deinococcus humi]MBB5362953.1 KipI family sensor histidine kinase inhibitor [Deinococcus humi]GGO25466.1 urea carboxylase [Deinococcus humi]
MRRSAHATGFYVQFSEELDLRQNARLHAFHRALRADLLPGVTDLGPGYVNLFVEYDEAVVSGVAVRGWVARHLRSFDDVAGVAGRLIELPVRYDGPDLPDVAARTGLSEAEVIRLHAGTGYHVYAVGFTPGFPFLGEVPADLRLPRRSTPRASVPQGAVAVANAQTCVYPLPSPGGWNLLGTALATIYDPNRAEPFLIAPGDRVHFRPSVGETPPLPEVRETWPAEPSFPAFRVERSGLLDLLMDSGRLGQAQVGLARSGPLDSLSAAFANGLVGNAPDAPLLELTLKGPVLTALRDMVVGVAGFGMRPEGRPMQQGFRLRQGETLRFASTQTGARAYLAVAGGFEGAPFLGSCSTDLIGRVGRPLRGGDVLGLATVQDALPGFASLPLSLPQHVTLRLLPGPQASPEALNALGSAPFRVAGSDRMGLRLGGTHSRQQVPGGQVTSEATPPGAVQVTPAGEPIILLSDRGRIGGYHKPAVVHPEDLPLAAQLRPGQLVSLNPDLSGTSRDWAQRWYVDARNFPTGEKT